MSIDQAIALADTVTPAPADAHVALQCLVRRLRELEESNSKLRRQLGAQERKLRAARTSAASPSGHPAITAGVPMDTHAAPVSVPAATAPVVRFVKIGADGKLLPHDATEWAAVLEPARSLMWSANDAIDEDVDYASAEAAVVALNTQRHAGFDDWRMPTVDELAGLVDRSRYSPAIDATYFPSTAHDFYWTSTPCAASPSYAWCVGFYYGVVYIVHRVFGYRVRAVRGPVRQ